MTEETAPQEAQVNKVEATAGAPINLKNRKIAIGFPSPDLIDVHFHNSLIQLITETSRFVPLGLTNSISSRIAQNRNVIVENARQLGATDILWIDSDSVFQPHSLMQLLMHDKDIVCATTTRRKGMDRSPVCVPLDFKSIEPHQRLVKMKQVGLPFMLTKMSVFDKLDELGMAPDKVYFAEPPRYIMKERGWDAEGVEGLLGEDEYFCLLAMKAGFDIWCDMELSMQIGHVGSHIFYIQQPETQIPEARVDEKL